MIIVLDSNVIIASLITKGNTHELVRYVLKRHRVYISKYIKNEVSDRLANKLNLPKTFVENLHSFFEDFFFDAEPDPQSETIHFPDPKDIPILQLAKKVRAHFLITGDKELLNLKKFEGVEIIYPSPFWKLERRGSS
ncbi:MAG: putative toxin-antitoxin system toxin component, PIN family [Candidatus Omnitrophica bacterium]|nr:putative toxin-antitoxin system toxin component, PIN family [Candidatus Omnitrophota bacterium]